MQAVNVSAKTFSLAFLNQPGRTLSRLLLGSGLVKNLRSQPLIGTHSQKLAPFRGSPLMIRTDRSFVEPCNSVPDPDYLVQHRSFTARPGASQTTVSDREL